MIMKLTDILPFLPPSGLAALEYALTESLDTEMSDDLFCSVIAWKEAVQTQGEALIGDDYEGVAVAITERLEDYVFGEMQR